MNYIYGTWSVLCAFNAAGIDHAAPEMRKAVAWLAAIQNPDGGWGEDATSYALDYRGYQAAPSTASQTAWALLAFMAAGDVDHPAAPAGSSTSRAPRRRTGLERAPPHRRRLPAHLLPALPRLCEILPRLGAGALPQPA
jgi:squalene-hopene/tetraprenyl-beta-curcumene cyclase